MLNLQEIVIVNGIGVVFTAFLLWTRFINIPKKNFGEYLFDAMIWITMFTCIMEIASFLVDGKIFPGCIALSFFLNTWLFISACVVGLLWCQYVDFRIYNSVQRIRRRVKYMVIPLAVDVTMCLINLSGCGLVFSVSEGNVYHRGNSTICVYILLFFYFIFSIWQVEHSKRKGLTIRFFPTLCFVVPCMAGTIVQALMYGVALGWAAVAMALLFVYIQLQSLNSLVDSLSGLYNRRYLDNILEHLHHNQNQIIYGVMIDANDFKSINDKFGHSQGDDAIRNIGKILSDSVADTCGIVVRYAGDEFIILLGTESEDEVNKTIQKINQNIEQFNESKNDGYHLSLSMGYVRFDARKDDTEDFLLAMDKNV